MGIKNIENTRDKLIKEWLRNIKINETNDTYLLLFDANKYFLKDLEETINLDEKNSTMIINDLDEFDTTTKNQNNIILNICSDGLENKVYVDTLSKILFKNVFLFIPEKSDFYINLKSYWDTTQNYDNLKIDTKRYFYYVGEFEPFEFIQKHSKEEIKLFMKYNIEYGLISLLKGDRDKYLFKQINVPENQIDKLFIDLDILKNENILTSRLAIVIYRMINNIQASTTAIGRYFHESTGSSSKAMKMAIDINATSDVYKVYDLNVKEHDLSIRKDIAKELLALNLKQLDTKKIAKVTKLPIETIKKLAK